MSRSCSTSAARPLAGDRAGGFAEHHDGAAALADVLVAQLANVPADHRLVAVEIAVPGHVAPDGLTVPPAPSAGTGSVWARPSAPRSAEAGLPDVSVGLSSDFHLAGLFAARSLLSDASSTVAAYFGGVSEVGSALVVNGEIFRGAGGGAGDLAHLHVQLDGARCWCGRHGCLNAVIRVQELLVQSGLRGEEEAAELVVTDPDGALALLVDAADAGEAPVLEALDKAGSALGRAVDDVVGSVNPHAVRPRRLPRSSGALPAALARPSAPRPGARGPVRGHADPGDR